MLERIAIQFCKCIGPAREKERRARSQLAAKSQSNTRGKPKETKLDETKKQNSAKRHKLPFRVKAVDDDDDIEEEEEEEQEEEENDDEE